MSILKATYNNSTTNATHVIEVPVDTTKTLTDSILSLKEQINAFLTHTLENETHSTKVTSVEEDEAEKQKEEDEAVEDEEDIKVQEGSTKDSPMSAERPNCVNEQASKKLKTNV
jgi:hypothetical protein